MFETLIYTYIGPCDFRDAVNMDGIAESSHKNRILQFNAECHRMCQSLDELIKSRPLHLYGLVIVNITLQMSHRTLKVFTATRQNKTSV